MADHLQLGMSRKWERHYHESTSLISSAVVIIGVLFIIPLVFIYPQYMAPIIFNSRLQFKLTVDVEDYWTCDSAMADFITDDPSAELQLLTFYVYNVTNAQDTIQRGFKPHLKQTGPYGYNKITYRYDISFDLENSDYVTYKELSMLRELPDPTVCTRMYFRMERVLNVLLYNPCANGQCDCISIDASVLVVNPHFLKLQNEVSPTDILAQFSLDIFSNIKTTIEEDFPRAVIDHLVPYSLQEVVMFRQKMQISVIIQTAFNFLSGTKTLDEIAKMMVLSNADYASRPCGLDAYASISTCPLTLQPYLSSLQSASSVSNLTADAYPNIAPLLDPKVNISILNFDTGLPLWIGLSTLPAGGLNFNSGKGFTMATKPELLELQDKVVEQLVDVGYSSGALVSKFQARVYSDTILAIFSFEFGGVEVGQYISGPSSVPNGTYIIKHLGGTTWRLSQPISNFPRTTVYSYAWVTPERLKAAKVIVQAVSYCIEVYWQPFLGATMPLLQTEFASSLEPVTCSPVGPSCIYQYAFMKNISRSLPSLSSAMISNLIDVATMTGANNANFYYQNNVPTYYNAYKYCSNYLLKGLEVIAGCARINPKLEPDGIVGLPAAIFGADRGVSGLNLTYQRMAFKKKDQETRNFYTYLACNLSTLMFEVYKTQTDYHDQFVVHYINNHKDSNMNHTFKVGEWKTLGYAQFGSGAITWALLEVRGIYQIMRDAMWYFGDERYYKQMIEFSSHVIIQGYIYAFIYDIDESRKLLEALADPSENGRAFRKALGYQTTTFTGNGRNWINGVGAVGDVAFTMNNGADAVFTCDGVNKETCDVIDQTVTSSHKQCEEIESLYDICSENQFVGDMWVTNCDKFRTSMTAPSSGIQCNQVAVYDNPHPYTLKRGGLLYNMLYSLTFSLLLTDGLWCLDPQDCLFNTGGPFITTTVRKLFFEGYSDPSFIKYYNVKLKIKSISFSCFEDAYDSCGNPNYHCSSKGFNLNLPNNKIVRIAYNVTSNDKFFSPYLEIAQTGEMLWPYSMDPVEVARAIKVKNDSSIWVEKILNPYFSLFPVWDSDPIYNKFVQCQKRLFGGPANNFNSCFKSVQTGRVNFHSKDDIFEYMGNGSIMYFNHNSADAIKLSGKAFMHQPAYGWDGFSTYPYTYAGRTTGSQFQDLTNPTIFHDFIGMPLTLDQSLIDPSEQSLTMRIPPIDGASGADATTKSASIMSRRFVESKDTWQKYQDAGFPLDSYGMPYKMPIGMLSLERMAGFPIFVGTANSYGNRMWGGLEYLDVVGLTPNNLIDYSFIDYDPVTGNVLRRAIRSLYLVRVERGPMLVNLVGSQGRCVSPTRQYLTGFAFGCYSYIPLFWYEDARLIDPNEHFELVTHFYERPLRIQRISNLGIAFGVCLIVGGIAFYLNDIYYRNRFLKRVYVD